MQDPASPPATSQQAAEQTDEETESAVAAHLLTDLDGDLLKELYKHVDVPFALKLVCHAMSNANPEPTVTKLRHVVSSVPMLSWAHDNGCPRTKWTCAWAACGGHVEVTQWARDNDCPWDGDTIRKAGGIPPLVALVRDGNAAQKHFAAVALQNLSFNADNKVAIAKAGGIPPLVALVRDGNDEQKEYAAIALEILAANCDDNKVLITKAKREAGLDSDSD